MAKLLNCLRSILIYLNFILYSYNNIDKAHFTTNNYYNQRIKKKPLFQESERHFLPPFPNALQICVECTTLRDNLQNYQIPLC